jgi:uncharacterized membrane protein YdfJ with MMPL/SSD domain
MVFRWAQPSASGAEDTFLVRALVIPSLETLVGRWNWWPSRLFKLQIKNPEEKLEIQNKK